MKGLRTILVLGILAASSPAFASHFQFRAGPVSCKGPTAEFVHDLGFHAVCGSVPVPEPATLGLLGIGLIGLAVKRRRK